MAKILSALTLLIAAVAAFLGFQSKGLIEKLQTAAATEHANLGKTQSDLKKSKDALKDAEAKTAKAEEDLATAKTKQQEAEDSLKKSADELSAAKTKLADTEKALAEAKGKPAMPDVDVDALKKQVADAQAKVAEAEGEAKTLKLENAELKTTVETLTVRVKDASEKVTTQSKVIKKYKDNVMEKGTRGTVMAVNSGWGFCVLSIGDRNGAAANRTLIVTRGGQAIGKVRITNVEASQSVADIIPGTFPRGLYVEPGDGVIYTGDDKVRVEEPEASPAGPNAPGPAAPVTPAPSGLPLPN